MSALDSLYSTWSPRLLTILRIVAAFLYMAHVFLYLAAAGGGPWSLDRAMGRDTS